MVYKLSETLSKNWQTLLHIKSNNGMTLLLKDSTKGTLQEVFCKRNLPANGCNETEPTKVKKNYLKLDLTDLNQVQSSSCFPKICIQNLQNF